MPSRLLLVHVNIGMDFSSEPGMPLCTCILETHLLTRALARARVVSSCRNQLVRTTAGKGIQLAGWQAGRTTDIEKPDTHE